MKINEKYLKRCEILIDEYVINFSMLCSLINFV